MNIKNLLKNLNEDEKFELLNLLEQKELEKVTPKMERFREPRRIKLAKGGRGAGAKSWSCASLLVQRAHREPLRIGCFREVQRSLEESCYSLIRETIERLRYPGWTITRDHINSPAGAHFIFRGLKDIMAAMQVKGLEGFDVFFIEEASTVSKESIKMMLPTLRKEGSELWAVWNPETDYDPIYTELWLPERDDVLRIELEPGLADNPHFPKVLQSEMETDYRNNPDDAEYIWGGNPRKQGENAVMSRVDVRAAASRIAEETDPDEIGVDVGRFGKDKTQMYRRRGAKTIAHRELSKKDTQFVAKEVWEFADKDRSIAIKVDDTGIGGGVTDRLAELGANVIPINFGGSPKDKKKYETVADEMWFDFPIDVAEIPNDPQLLQELGGRLYDHDKIGRRKIEQKKKFKERFGRSPDKADALLLCYYPCKSGALDNELRKQMAARRRRGE
ncbi:MAG: phage terminase large subunit [Treponema sp.]|nr:phage terminase large subunit [Treponema sp.]